MDRVRSTLPSRRQVAGRALGRAEGQGLVEYSLILLLVAVAMVGALVSFQGGLTTTYASFVSAFPSA